jgi:curved DNA-binding protein CbpA
MTDILHAEPDYYAVLRVPPDATAADIEQAYRDLAGKRLNARWRPGQAARELALLNAAYGILGYPDRREDYDRRRGEAAAQASDGQVGSESDNEELEPAVTPMARARQQLPRVQLGRPTSGSPADAVIIVLVVLFALVAASFLASRSLVDLSFVQGVGDSLGINPRRRPTATPNQASIAQPTTEAKPSPAPPTATAVEPLAPPGALPTALAGQRFAGSQVLLSDTRPARESNLTVTLQLVQEGRPVPNARVYLTAHYRTLDERQPPGSSTVSTDARGIAAITFGIGDATPNYPVKLDVTALVDGQQVVFQSSFTPR